mgnify:CR=1 FL=1
MIRFERVTYTYPFQTCPAVSDISFSVRPGELVLCTGASGCGKSTLMRLANGLCPHYFQGTLEGRVLIGGEPTDARPINAIAREVGFGDASNFSTRFANATGQSPLQYRKSALKPLDFTREAGGFMSK